MNHFGVFYTFSFEGIAPLRPNRYKAINGENPMRKLVCVLITLATWTVTGMSADDSISVMESRCANFPIPCNLLCQEAWSAESRARALEMTVNDARYRAEMAKIEAVYYENTIKQITLEAQQSRRKKSRNNNPDKKSFWKMIDSVLRIFVPPPLI